MQQHTWWRKVCLTFVLPLGVGLVVSFAACSPGTSGAAPQGTLHGVVVAGPTCPVERVDQPCPPKPVPNRVVLIQTLGGAMVTRVTTDQNGEFTVTLAPGTYDLSVAPGASLYPIQRMPQQVTIVAGQTAQVKIQLDTGIR